jgi:predicted small integral membrane protein
MWKFVHALTVVSFALVVLSAIYFVDSLSFVRVFVVSIFAFVIGWKTRPKKDVTSVEALYDVSSFGSRALNKVAITGLVFCDSVLVALYCFLRTDDAIVTPWQILPVGIFLVYAISSFFLIVAYRSSRRRTAIALTILHAVTSWSVAMIIFALGFGFDPFIHQAAERFIFASGAVFPKQLFYNGQYALVVAISHLTRVSIELIDTVLVPLASALLLPFALWIGMRLRLPNAQIRTTVGLAALFLIPTSFFTFTIPFHLAALFSIIAIELYPLRRTSRGKLVLVALACAAFVTHPLIGLPTLIMICVGRLPERAAKYRRVIPIALFVWLALFGAFVVYVVTQGQSIAIPSWTDVWQSLRALFFPPFTLDGSSIFFRSIYSVHIVWPIFLYALAWLGYRTLDDDAKEHTRHTFALAIGLFLAAVSVGVFIRIPNIIAAEQFEFSLRLLSFLPVIFLPEIGIGIAKICARYSHVILAFYRHSREGGNPDREDQIPYISRKWIPVCTGMTKVRLLMRKSLVTAPFIFWFLIALGMTQVWYFAYPQFDPVLHATAFGTSRADMDIIKMMERIARDESHIFLAPQMTAAAAIKQYGFSQLVKTRGGDRLFMSLPTGGELYAYYLRLYSEDADSVLRDCFYFADVKTIFVFLPYSRDPDERVAKSLMISGGQIVRMESGVLAWMTRDF